ncbi:MAG: hypothetical protein K5681_10040 [Treponema sp.]|nr:hypothetical protein [Treponema sp.]
MFLRCSSLNSITCLATEISEYAFSGECLDGVASSGTFICPSSMKAYWTNKLSSGDIPPNWTIEDYTVQ